MLWEKVMKVVCIKKIKLDIDDYTDLTIGHVYDVLDECVYGGHDVYEIDDDNNDRCLYRIINFMPLAEWREQQINSILE